MQLPDSRAMIPGSSGAKARDTEPSSLVVVDASFVLKLVLPEKPSDGVRRAWGKWVEQGVEVSAPYLLLCHKAFHGELTPEEGEAALLAIQAQDTASRRLALAELLGCELWTADMRLKAICYCPLLRPVLKRAVEYISPG